MLKYDIVKAMRPQMRNFGRYVAKVRHLRTVGTDRIAIEMERDCCVKVSDVRACIAELSEKIITHLHNGDIVVLDGIGRFKLELDCKSSSSPSSFTSAHITGIHCIFKPASYKGSIGMYEVECKKR
jgi:hypothetical protein